MKKIIATAIASFAFIALAHAGEVEGTVAEVDTENGMITLEDGRSFPVVDSVALEDLAAGAQVVITFDDATNNVTAIELK